MYLEEGKESLRCSYCAYVYALSTNSDGVRLLPEEKAGVACPVCREELQRALAGPHPLLCCPACEGVLVEMGQFMKVVRILRSKARIVTDAFPPPAAIEFERRIDCPHCGEAMSTHAYCGPGNIVIDNCPRCAVNWLDRHEMERVVTAPDESRSEKAWVAPEVKETGAGISRGAIR